MHDTRRTSKLFEKLAATTKGLGAKSTPERVHQLRTTIRRVETLFAAHKSDVRGGNKKLLKQLARLRRRAGKVRDIDVQKEALGGITLDGSRRESLKVMHHLDKAHAKYERKLAEAREEELQKGLSRRLKRAMTDLTSDERPLSARNDFTQAALRKFAALARRYAQLDEANLHEFRLRCKHVRYLAELEGDAGRSKPVIAELKRIQDAAGQWHDWVALTEVAQEVLDDASSPLLSALRTQQRAAFLSALRISNEARQTLLSMRASLPPSRKGPRSSRSAPTAEALEGRSSAGAA